MVYDEDLRDLIAFRDRLREDVLLHFDATPGSLRTRVRQVYCLEGSLGSIRAAQTKSEERLRWRAV